MDAMSKSMNDLITEKLVMVMGQYNDYRRNLAKQGLEGSSIKHGLEEESIWEGKIKQLKGILKDKKILFPAKQSKVIALGSRAEVGYNGNIKSVIIDGVGFFDKESKIQVISCKSPIGSSLLGKKEGEKIAIGTKKIKVIKIYNPW